MANFPRVNPAGWGVNADFLSAEANQLDIDHAKSVNGDDGGTYAGDLIWTGTHTYTNVLELTNVPELTAKTYPFVQPIMAGNPNLGSNDYWELDDVAVYNRCWVQRDVGGSRYLIIPLTNLPHLGELKTATVYIDGGNGHAHLPATKPSCAILKRTVLTGLQTNIGGATDAPADVAAYEMFHKLGGGSFAINAGNLVDGTSDFYASITGETGANSQVGVMVFALVIECECSYIAPG